MPSGKGYLDFILDQLSGLDIGHGAMMGEYLLYIGGRLFGGIYDDRLLVKPIPAALELIPDAAHEAPYPGAKEMLLVDRVDDSEFLCRLVTEMYDGLPEVRKKR